MKIAVTGAHRVGKTTLVHLLQESLPDYVCIREPYYALEERHHIFSDPPSLEDYIIQFEYSIDHISKHGNKVIFDRCPIDLLAYIQVISSAEEWDIDFPTLYNRAEDAICKIDLLVFVPIEESDRITYLESDGSELRSQVHELLSNWIHDLKTEAVEVKGSVRDRRNQVIEYLLKKEI